MATVAYSGPVGRIYIYTSTHLQIYSGPVGRCRCVQIIATVVPMISQTIGRKVVIKSDKKQSFIVFDIQTLTVTAVFNY